MPDAALLGYETAVEASPEGPLRREAASNAAALRARPRADDAAQRERERLAALDAEFAKLPRSCPAWRDHSLPK
jgi:hypothetical protein